MMVLLMLGLGQAQAGKLRLIVENDAFASDDDKDYTSGIKLAYIAPSDKNGTDSSYHFGHEVYTPVYYERTLPDVTDRPYAAYIYAGRAYNTYDSKTARRFDFMLGLTGKLALGEDTQSFIHRIFDEPQPQGWDYQIGTEIGITHEQHHIWHKWRQAERGDISFRIAPEFSFALGNIRTHAQTGMRASMSRDLLSWRTRAGLALPVFEGAPTTDMPWVFTAGAAMRAVAHNIFLDGDWDGNDPSVEKKPLIFLAHMGVATAYAGVQINYEIHYISREFEQQWRPTSYGHISLAFAF